MTRARAVEYQIIQDLMQRRDGGEPAPSSKIAERLITAAAVTSLLLLLGSCAQELLWAALAGATVLTLGTRSA
jgi:hypothetical protein